MLLDKRSTFARSQALSLAAPATSKLGEAIDLQVTGIDQGAGGMMHLVALVEVTATSGGAATLQLELVTADSEDLATAPVVLVASPVVAVASMVSGTRLLMVELPRALYKRWIGIRQVVGGAAFTAGSVNVFMTQDPANWYALPDAVNG